MPALTVCRCHVNEGFIQAQPIAAASYKVAALVVNFPIPRKVLNMLQSHESNLHPGWFGPNPKKYRRCPHCDHPMTLNEAVKVLYGDGRKKYIGVRIQGIGVAVIDASHYTPTTMELLE